MNPATADLLRAIAALASHAQAHPTDAAGIGKLRTGRAKAEAAWIQAGSPDLPASEPKPAVRAPPLPADSNGEKDWTREGVDVEVTRTTEKAVLLSDGDREFWCPRSLIDGGDTLALGDVDTLSVPRWILAEAKPIARRS